MAAWPILAHTSSQAAFQASLLRHCKKAANFVSLAEEVKTTNFQIAKKIGAKGTRSTTLSRLHSEALS